jgi:peptide/nickel transport system substrate-binding protein
MKRGLLAGAVLLWALHAQASERVTIGMQLEPPILDPTANPAAAISEILDANVFEGLVQFAADGSVVPKLAAAWEISQDGLSYVFHLQKGVRFHDGSAFDAAVAKFSLDRARGPGSVNPQKSRLNRISTVDVVDPFTLRISL